MDNLLDVLAQLENLKNQMQTLEENYKHRTKSASYHRAKESLINKIPFLYEKATNLGTKGNLFELEFLYYKGTKQTKGIMYLSNIDESSILPLIQNVKKYQSIIPDTLEVTEIFLGTVKSPI